MRAVARRDNWGGGLYSYIQNNHFQRKSVGQNTNIIIYEYAPPPNYRSSYDPDYATLERH